MSRQSIRNAMCSLRAFHPIRASAVLVPKSSGFRAVTKDRLASKKQTHGMIEIPGLSDTVASDRCELCSRSPIDHLSGPVDSAITSRGLDDLSQTTVVQPANFCKSGQNGIHSRRKHARHKLEIS